MRRHLLIVVFCLVVGVTAPAVAAAPAKPAEPPACTLGSSLSYPVALDIDEFGRMYVLDNGRQEVMCFGPDGRLERSWLTSRSATMDLNYRWSIRVVDNGDIYLSPGNFEHDVRRIGAADGAEFSITSKDADGVYFAVAADGTVFKTGALPGKGWDHGNIVTLAPDGTEKARWTTPFMWPMAAGSDGLLYAWRQWHRASSSHSDGTVTEIPPPPDDEQGRITVYDATGQVVRHIDVRESGCTGNPNSMALDENGDIYLVYPGQVYHVDGSGKLIARWGIRHDPGGDVLIKGIAVRKGIVYTLFSVRPSRNDQGASQKSERDTRYGIQCFTPDGHHVASYVSPRLPLDLPGALAVQKDGTCAVIESALKELALLDPSGKLSQTRPNLGHVMAVGAAPDSAGFYASGWYADGKGIGIELIYPDGRSERKSPPGNWHVKDLPGAFAVRQGSDETWALAQFDLYRYGRNLSLVEKSTPKIRAMGFPKGIAVDRKGCLYLADPVNHRVVKTDSAERTLLTFGSEGSGIGQLQNPWCVALDEDGNVFVADTGNSRIAVFSPAGEPLGVWGHHGHGSGELDRPLALAMGPSNTLWIADTHNNRIVQVPLRDLWKQISKAPYVEPKVVAAKPEPLPAAGDVTITGIVTAGTDDLTDCVYLESPERIWGVNVTVPAGASLIRGNKCSVTGKLEIKARAVRRLVASNVVTIVDDTTEVPGPLAMANLYVGDGFRASGRQVDLTNLGLLVRTWGRVKLVDAAAGYMVIDDGSSVGTRQGLLVRALNLRAPVAAWPAVGDYVAVTGISVNSLEANGTYSPSIRIRSGDDIQVLSGG